MSSGAARDVRRQKFDHRTKPVVAAPGYDGRCHQQAEIARFDDPGLLPVGARLPARLRDQPQADAAGDQGQLQLVTLDLRAEIEMSSLTVERTLQGRPEAATT